MPKYMPRFKDEKHKSFYLDCLSRLPSDYQDSYHRALFYILGACADCRRNIDALYNFNTREIQFKGFSAAWQTGTSIKVTRLAFNLFNGYCGEDAKAECSGLYTPYELFDCDLQPYMLEAIRLKYPAF